MVYWVNTEFEQRYEDAMNSILSTGSATFGFPGGAEATVSFNGG